MSEYQMDGTKHVTGEPALWQELCQAREKNERLLGLLRDSVQLVLQLRAISGGGLLPGDKWLEATRKELAE